MSENPVPVQNPVPSQTVQQNNIETINKARADMEARIAADKKLEQEKIEQEKFEKEAREKEEIIIGERLRLHAHRLNSIAQVLKDSGVDSMGQIKAITRIKEILESD